MRSSGLPRIASLLNCRARIQTQETWFQNPKVLNHSSMLPSFSRVLLVAKSNAYSSSSYINSWWHFPLWKSLHEILSFPPPQNFSSPFLDITCYQCSELCHFTHTSWVILSIPLVSKATYAEDSPIYDTGPVHIFLLNSRTILARWLLGIIISETTQAPQPECIFPPCWSPPFPFGQWAHSSQVPRRQLGPFFCTISVFKISQIHLFISTS